MAARVRRNGGNGLEAWPGYVDALSTLLMVIIFVLLVFVLAQAFLSVTLSGRSHALDKANQQLAELTDALSLERGHASDLQASISQLTQQLSAGSAARDKLNQQIAVLRGQTQQIESEREKLSTQLSEANVSVQSANTANAALTSQLGDTKTQLATAQQQLTDARNHLAEMQRQIADLDKTVSVGKDTLQAKISDLAKLAEQARALAALRDELEKQAQDAAVRATTEQQRREAVQVQLADEKKLGDSAKAQIALLNQQIDQFKAQLSSVAKALDLAQQQGHDKDVKITNLGQKLNAALASQVEELKQYRSEFFGKLRALLANRSGIQVVGDRFVFQSEVLFPVGSADLTPAGVAQMTTLAVTIKDIASEIPPDLHWILRVDGHTDPQPVKGGQFASNWELSAARAITVVKLLIADGVPADHLAATGFGEYQPFGPGDTPDDYAKDRRIELRLTDR
ncbi:MAG TPA: peptidoglycan -binding protein [Acetobacteraceae bacterium]|nr:peptidoglycan -binding protein [Acetobacteraceae bacterium]